MSFVVVLVFIVVALKIYFLVGEALSRTIRLINSRVLHDVVFCRPSQFYRCATICLTFPLLTSDNNRMNE